MSNRTTRKDNNKLNFTNTNQRASLNDDARKRDEAALAKLDDPGAVVRASDKKFKSTSRRSSAKRFSMPEAEVRPGDYTPGKRNPIHSILTALPVLMLIAGLYYFYSGESAQTEGAPILAESVAVQGSFSGLSEIKSGSDGQHFLWLADATRKRGVRIQLSEVAVFADMERGLPMQIDMAPTVSGSSTYWAWRVIVNGELVLERETLDNK